MRLQLSCVLLVVAAAAPSRAGAAPNPHLFDLMDVFELEWASDPQISPDGSQVVYVRNSMDVMKDRKRAELWIVDTQGRSHRRLTIGDGRESSPRWSPDGRRLAYVSNQGGSSQIHLRWMDSGQTAKLSQLTRSPRGLAFSPDGTRLAFSMLVPAEPPRLATLPAKPKGAQWAKAPRYIVRVRNRADGVGYLEHGFYQLFVLPTEGGTPRQLTTGDFNHRSAPVWAPASDALLFSANRNDDWEYEFRNSEIYEVSVEGGQVQALTSRNGPDRSPTISPDGKRIAYLGFDDRVQTYQVTKLYVANRDGSRARALTADLDRDAAAPIWAANGRGIFFSYDDEGNTKVAHANLDGEIRVLAESLGGTSYGRPYGGGSFSVSTLGRFAYTVGTPTRPADVVVGGRNESGTKRLTALNSDLLDHKQLGKVEEIWWDSSHDGRKVQGWLVTPSDFDASRKYPLILEIHGGPISN